MNGRHSRGCRARLTAILTGTAAIAIGALGPAGAGAAGDGQIAIVGSNPTTGVSGIALIPSDRLATATDAQVLVTGPGTTLSDLQWTPDGKTLVYVQRSGKFDNVHGVDVASKRRWLIASHVEGETAALSPDGTTVAYERPATAGLPGEVYLVGVDGHSARRLGAGYYASWSPDGSRLALATGSLTDPGSLVTVRADGSGRRRVGRFRDVSSVAWAPDGTSFVVTTLDVATFDFVIALVGPNGRVLHTLTRAAERLAPSPLDGRQIAFTLHKPRDRHAVVVANADGSDRHTILRPSTSGTASLAWSPDARWVVTADEDRVRVVRPDGTGARTVAFVGDGTLQDPAWQPQP